jgi:NAD(P)-dependent dehydrogenase (short-subunit alcohol dehydrogenase family)
MPRRILIIGASSTLGLATARLFSSDQLWLTYRSEQKETLLREACPTASITRLDVNDRTGIAALETQVRSNWKALDGLVLAFGGGMLQPAQMNQPDAVANLLQVNVCSVLQLARTFFRLLSNGSLPAVVGISSIMGLVGTSGMSAYAASKGAIASLTRALAIEWAPKKIRVNAIAPGVVPSPLVSDMFSMLAAEQVEMIRMRHPLGFGEPRDVAHAVYFLLSPEAKWITGTVLPVDGGYTAQ